MASKYAGDTGIAQHPAVIFADNFESGSLPGPWDEARNQKTGLNLARVPGGPVGKRSLRVEAHLGKDPGGGVTKWFQPTSTLHANALTMEASITDRWTKNPVPVVSFDNVLIAKESSGSSKQVLPLACYCGRTRGS